MLQLFANVMLHIAAINSWVFVLAYAIFAPWHRSTPGRHIMATTLLLAVILSYVSLVNLGVLQNIPPMQTQWVRLAIFAALAGVMFWRVYILVNVQLRGRREK